MGNTVHKEMHMIKKLTHLHSSKKRQFYLCKNDMPSSSVTLVKT